MIISSKIEEMSSMLGSIQHEIQKLVQGKASVAAAVVGQPYKTTVGPSYSSPNLQSLTTFASNFNSLSVCSAKECDYNTWIVDTCATDHITPNQVLFYSVHSLRTPISVHLPDGSATQVLEHGQIVLHANLTLQDTLFLLTLKYNLLSVSKQLKTTKIMLTFHSSSCLFQDLVTDAVIVVAKEADGLYKLNRLSFSPFTINCYLNKLKKQLHPFITFSPPSFNGDNYPVWVVKMRSFLKAMNLWEPIESDANPPPLGSDPTLAQIKKYEEDKAKKNKALTCIHSAMTDATFFRIMACETANEAWDKLKEEFEGSDRVKSVKLLTLKRKFEMLKIKESKSVKDYSTKLMDLVN
ncbi:hypothetical protein GH714_027926 [Hevea brasiliensis]|uniref:Retrovirus-related Pol polyprotein from transposon TNT 1-94-like beta-barrel domain-containing protein n=1 Tax=Hevea brasiliensis TaxID=3981 RepID=A0A6A6MRT9_HEVBR|nr:hypothetical protein GH714_027926 [Hevea brasiliensis]